VKRRVTIHKEWILLHFCLQSSTFLPLFLQSNLRKWSFPPRGEKTKRTSDLKTTLGFSIRKEGLNRQHGVKNPEMALGAWPRHLHAWIGAWTATGNGSRYPHACWLRGWSLLSSFFAFRSVLTSNPFPICGINFKTFSKVEVEIFDHIWVKMHKIVIDGWQNFPILSYFWPLNRTSLGVYQRETQ